jgi:two-component system, OmpR family, sensor histidine kinase ChvG
VKSIRWKIILTSLLVVFVPIYWLNRNAIQFFDRFTRKALEEQMIDCAFIVGEEYKGLMLSAPPQPELFDCLLQSYEPETETSICLLGTNGIVLFDSGTNSLVGVDFSDRREVRKALQGRYGARNALTSDRQYMYYYVALPVCVGNEVVAVAYAFRHTGPIVGAIKRMAVDQRLATVSAVLLAGVIATVLAYTLTRRLRKLTRAVVAYAKGTAPWNAQLGGRDEIGELARSMNSMVAELDKRNQYNHEFVSTVMHELKTPLTAVKGSVEILEDGAGNNCETRRRFLGNIHYEVERMIRMVGELNELTKLDVEGLRSQKEQVDYGQFVRAVVDRLEPTFDQEHARLEVIVPDTPIPVLIVPGRIEQVIANLLDNAFRCTPPAQSVKLQVELGADKCAITSVQDTGCGISPANLPKIFDRFFTTEPKDKPGHVHSGLGLAIAKTIVENHRGKLWVESQMGQGACFSFSLPTT